MGPLDSPLPYTFTKDRHIRYWLRCAKTFLPHNYQSSDANRMLLAFLTVAALDLLDVLESKIIEAERLAWVSWIYSCQTAEGGFRGFSGTNLGDLRNGENAHWDPPNLPATFFALTSLALLGDDLEGVNRKGCLNWVGKLQRCDGSFGETIGEEGAIEGGADLRFCLCAIGVRFVLSGRESGSDDGRLLEYIRSCQTFEGGFSEGPSREAHCKFGDPLDMQSFESNSAYEAGLTYCAVGALAFLDKESKSGISSSLGADNLDELLEWLLKRQTTYIEDFDSDEEEEGAGDDELKPRMARLSLNLQENEFVGVNGRVNKIADTCYCWWNIGALKMLGHEGLANTEGVRAYLLGKVQHVIGGFGKGVDEPPDILHSYLGLATLALLDEPGLKSVNAEFCMSEDAAKRVEAIRWSED